MWRAITSGMAVACLLSLPSVNSDGTRARALGAAKKRDSAQAKDRAHEQLKYERSHND